MMSTLDHQSSSENSQMNSQLTAKTNGEHLFTHCAQAARLIGDVQTEVVVQNFADRIFVLVTQLGRIGCFIQVNPAPPTMLSPSHNYSSSHFPDLPVPNPSMTLQNILGAAPNNWTRALHEMYANQIGAIIFSESSNDSLIKPVLLGIALKPLRQTSNDAEEVYGVLPEERLVFGEIMSMVKECKIW